MAGHPEPEEIHPLPGEIDPNASSLSMQPEDYIRNRLLVRQRWYYRKYIRMKNWHYTFQAIAVIGGLIVAWLGTVKLPGKDLTISILGLLVSISVAAESLFRFRENWKVWNSISLNLDHERTTFMTRTGEYVNLGEEEAFRKFVAKVEAYQVQSNRDLVERLTQSKG